MCSFVHLFSVKWCKHCKTVYQYSTLCDVLEWSTECISLLLLLLLPSSSLFRLRNIRYMFNLLMFLLATRLVYIRSQIAREVWSSFLGMCLLLLRKLGFPTLQYNLQMSSIWTLGEEGRGGGGRCHFWKIIYIHYSY